MPDATQTPEAQEVSRTFIENPLSDQLQKFRGATDPRTAVSEFIKQQAARTEYIQLPGTVDTPDREEKVRNQLARPISDYLSLIIKIGEAMRDEVGKEFTEGQVRIAQVRTDLDFRSWLVKVMFIVDADSAEELHVSQMLNHLEKIVLLSHSFAAELDYVNKRDGSLDWDSLRRRYPFVAKVKPKP